jgi:hypothetical protein
MVGLRPHSLSRSVAAWAPSTFCRTPIAQEMTQRGPRAELVEFPKIGHAPALIYPTQIAIIAQFLRP